MQPKASGRPNRLDERIERFRDHPALGLPARFYLRRREQLLYLVVGGWNTVFGYGVWALLQFLLGDHLHYLVIVVLAWPIAVLNAYLGYRLIVFRSHGSILRELPRFSLVYVVSLVFSLVALPIALNILPFNIYVVQALLGVAVIVGSYLSHRYFSFGASRQRNAPPPASLPPAYRPPAVSED